MTKMHHTLNGSLFTDMYEMIAEMGNKTAWHRLNWISYLGIVCMMKQTVGLSVAVTIHAGLNFQQLFWPTLLSLVILTF